MVSQGFKLQRVDKMIRKGRKSNVLFTMQALRKAYSSVFSTVYMVYLRAVEKMALKG